MGKEINRIRVILQCVATSRGDTYVGRDVGDAVVVGLRMQMVMIDACIEHATVNGINHERYRLSIVR